MKAVILAGGLGSRLSEETGRIPKPMVEVGGRPILWHIMKYFSSFGVDDFVICCGYRGYVIKEFFANYFVHTSDITFDMRTNQMEVHQRRTEPWRVTVVDTGDTTQTGGRLKRVAGHVEGEDSFFFTYGDGLADIDLDALLGFHRSMGVLATVTAVTPPGRFGTLQMATGSPDLVASFSEKATAHEPLINGGFFVLSPRAIDFVAGDDTVWERTSLPALAEAGALAAFRHTGFWQPMDTLRERQILEERWAGGAAPWHRW